MDTLGRVKCAILGSRGLVAQRLLQILTNHHWLVPTHVVGSKESAGISTNDIPWSFNESKPDLPEIIVREIGSGDELASELISQGVRIVFSALPDCPASLIEEDLARSGLVVLSHSTIHRHSDMIPLIVPEVNPDHLDLLDLQYEFGSGALVACSNCMVVPLAVSLAPILRKFPVNSIHISTEQSVSGAGRRILEGFRDGVIPNPEITGESESVESELRRIFGEYGVSGINITEIEIAAKCKRASREFGHSASVTVELGKNASAHEVIEAWSDFQSPVQHLDLPSGTKKPLIFASDINHSISSLNPPESKILGGNPQKKMEVCVGEVNVSGDKLCFKVVSDNTVRGAAGNSVLLAEMMLAQGIIHDSKNTLTPSQHVR